MTSPTHPLLFAALTQPKRWGAPYSHDRLDRIQDAIATMAAGTAAGEIPNVVYTEARERLSRALYDAWSALPQPSYEELRGQPQAEALDEAFFGTGLAFTNAKGKLPKLKKLDHPLLAPRVALLEEVLPLVQEVNDLKAKVVKRKVKTDEERAQDEANRFHVPRSSSRAVEQVRGLLEQVVASQFEDLVRLRQDHHQRVLAHFLNRQEQAKTDPSIKGKDWRNHPNPDYTVRIHATYRVQGRDRVNGNLMAFLQGVLTPVCKEEGHCWSVEAPHAPQVIETLARKEATELRDQFIYKNLSKIASLLETKGDDLLLRAEVRHQSLSLAQLEGRLRFDFRDGSGFETTTGLVFVSNQYGTDFYRFPLTFHEVRLPGGVKMPSPSEERMHTVFLPATGTAPLAPAESSPTAPTPRRRRR